MELTNGQVSCDLVLHLTFDQYWIFQISQFEFVAHVPLTLEPNFAVPNNFYRAEYYFHPSWSWTLFSTEIAMKKFGCEIWKIKDVE